MFNRIRLTGLQGERINKLGENWKWRHENQSTQLSFKRQQQARATTSNMA